MNEYDAAKLRPNNINPYALNMVMEFDHVIRVHADGRVTDAGEHAPELHDGELIGQGWTLMDGYSGQYGYSGPLMQESEFVGGRMAHDILDKPGLYVCVANYCDGDDAPTEWAVAFRPTN